MYGRFLKTFFLLVLLGSTVADAQSPASTPVGKTIYRDHDGNLISNNEFVDIRMANFHYPDATVTRTLDDGTVEMRTQKIPQEGMHAPDFTVKTLEGRSLSSADFRGKVVVLNFWFIGCPVCRSIKPKLNDLKAKFAGDEGVVFLALTYEPAAAVERYLKKEPFNYLHVADAGAELRKFVFGGYPKNIVISKTGQIVYWRSPIFAWDKFESVVRAELTK